MTDPLILDAIDAFLARDVAPHVHALEHDDIYPEAIVARMRELGLFGATIGTAYGGLGLPCATYADIVERIARVDVVDRHLQFSPDHVGDRAAQSDRGTEAGVPAAVRVG